MDYQQRIEQEVNDILNVINNAKMMSCDKKRTVFDLHNGWVIEITPYHVCLYMKYHNDEHMLIIREVPAAFSGLIQSACVHKFQQISVSRKQNSNNKLNGFLLTVKALFQKSKMKQH